MSLIMRPQLSCCFLIVTLNYAREKKSKGSDWVGFRVDLAGDAGMIYYAHLIATLLRLSKNLDHRHHCPQYMTNKFSIYSRKKNRTKALWVARLFFTKKNL